ncbi:integrase/recombinase xerD homolog [Sycon ciliatum]|uniref:integrase/recombinase xerD homolog n=1 Tax=Sycon ciliatum TaxID=27933 RepID=UPI0031F69514
MLEGQAYQWLGLSASTRATYATAWKRLHQFCQLVGTKVITDTIMLAFVAYLARQNAASTVRLYVSAIRAIAKENGKDLSSRRVDLAVQGVARAQANRTKNASKPILLPHMAAMRNALIRSNLNATDRAMVWAAICLGFFACLWASEYTSTTATTMSDGGLRTEDLSITPQAIQVTIKKSKTDQLGKGHSVRLTTTNSTVCPVRAMHTYLSRRPNLPNRPLFIDSCGKFLTA